MNITLVGERPPPHFLLYQIQGHKRYRGIVLNEVHIVHWKEDSDFANIPGGTYSSLSAPLSSTAKIAPTSLVSGWFQQGLQEDSTFCVEQSSAGLLFT